MSTYIIIDEQEETNWQQVPLKNGLHNTLHVYQALQ